MQIIWNTDSLAETGSFLSICHLFTRQEWTFCSSHTNYFPEPYKGLELARYSLRKGKEAYDGNSPVGAGRVDYCSPSDPLWTQLKAVRMKSKAPILGPISLPTCVNLLISPKLKTRPLNKMDWYIRETA